MAYLLLVVKSAFRNRLRTLLTATGVAIAIIAFLFLRTFIAAWYGGVDASATDRLIVRNKISITFPLPLSYTQKVRSVPGVTDVSWANWFGGVYQDPKQFFAQFAVDPESYYRIYPEYELPEAQKKAFFADRTGCVVGDLLAEKYHWKVGDKVTLKGTIYSGDWDFTIDGIYHGRDKATDRQQFHFHWKYLNERSPEGMKEKAGIIVVKVAGGATDVAQQIDALFKNSLAETRTESEKAFQLSFISMASAIITAIQVVSGVVLVILILILGNTLAMATRERTMEYAAMRAIGFRPSHIVGLVLGEGFVVALAGVVIGLLLAPPILRYFAELFQKQLGAFLGSFELDPKAALLASAIALAGGMLAAALPAWRAGRMRIVDALRRVE
ncbi:MAG TPA: ABC transporter permease [Polyangia bacterium]